MQCPDYSCASCGGTGILGGNTTDDVWEACPEEHIEESEDE